MYFLPKCFVEGCKNPVFSQCSCGKVICQYHTLDHMKIEDEIEHSQKIFTRKLSQEQKQAIFQKQRILQDSIHFQLLKITTKRNNQLNQPIQNLRQRQTAYQADIRQAIQKIQSLKSNLKAIKKIGVLPIRQQTENEFFRLMTNNTQSIQERLDKVGPEFIEEREQVCNRYVLSRVQDLDASRKRQQQNQATIQERDNTIQEKYNTVNQLQNFLQQRKQEFEGFKQDASNIVNTIEGNPFDPEVLNTLIGGFQSIVNDQNQLNAGVLQQRLEEARGYYQTFCNFKGVYEEILRQIAQYDEKLAQVEELFNGIDF